jgi:hypothetical protein
MFDTIGLRGYLLRQVLRFTMGEPADGPMKNPQRYEIAQPQSYSAFPLDPAQTQPGDLRATSAATERAPHESWDDAGKDVPEVAEKDRANFIPPDHPAVEAAAPGSLPREKRAIWIVHGMGQQIPFETVDGLARGVLQALAQQNPPQHPVPRLRTVKIAGQVLQRVEIDVRGSAPDAKLYDLHLYETYWAPKTEGVAKLSDVISFLWDGGLRGLLNSFKPFQRAMFGGMGSFKIPLRSPVYLCITLLVLVALTVINGVILASAAAKINLAPLVSFTAHWHQLAAIASCMIAEAFTFGIVLFLADLCKPQNLGTFAKRFLSYLGWASLIFTIVQILITALLMTAITHLDWLTAHNYVAASQNQASTGVISVLLHKFFSLVSWFFVSLPVATLQAFATGVILCAAILLAIAMILGAFLRSSESPLRGNSGLLFFTFLAFIFSLLAIVAPPLLCFGPRFAIVLPPYLFFIQSSLWVFPFLILFSAKVREIMVQYVGDVAIYVRPNKLDRFDEVRNEIKEAARSVVSAIFTVYAGPNNNQFLYDRVALIGHSLGSVIAYDTLNRLMLDDWLSGNALHVAERVKTMITFGSPLNKTAFFFTIQAKDSLHIRERLASTVQPLITSYPKFRKLAWINVYSPNDIVSGRLQFYDLPGFQVFPAVTNIPDPDAFVPLVAHVSYWNNSVVWQQLLQQIAP